MPSPVGSVRNLAVLLRLGVACLLTGAPTLALSEEVVDIPTRSGVTQRMIYVAPDSKPRADSCSVTLPRDPPLLTDRLPKAAARHSVVQLSGGQPKGDLCNAESHHGFGGLDVSATQAIIDFIFS